MKTWKNISLNKRNRDMIITLPLPPSDNHTYGQRGKIRFMYQEAKDWKFNVGLIIKSKYKKSPSLGDIVIKQITFYLKHWRDIQGSLKLIFDSMEEIVYQNDNQVVQFGPVMKKTDKLNPRVEIEL